MASGQDLGGTTLMDLITSDPVPSTQGAGKAAVGGTVPMHSPPPTFGKDKKTKKPSLMTQIQSDPMSVAKVLTPVKTNIIPSKHKKKLGSTPRTVRAWNVSSDLPGRLTGHLDLQPLSYSQLARSIHELAASGDQKSSQKQLVHQVFPKLAVYNSVDPSLAPSLVMLHQQCEDRSVLRYIYYYLARILSDTGAQGISAGGGIPTPNWDALADLDAVGGVTRADVVPRIIEQLTAEASNADVEVHARRVAALKALTCGPINNTEFLSKLYEIIFGILDKVADAGKVRRKKGMFGKQTLDKESAIQSNLQYAAISSLRRLPLDPGNPAFLHRAVQGISFADPVAVRHALAMASDIATRDPYAVAMTVAKLALPGGALQEVLHLHDVLARVYLARLCFTLSRARVLDERPDIKSQFTTVLYQLLLDPSERVCFEAIMCILGKFDNTERPEERAAGWARLTSEILKLPEAPALASKKENISQAEGGATQSKDGLPSKGQNERPAPRPRRPQALIKLVMRRLESAFRSFSRPVLHAAARVVQEMGKSRAAAFSLGVYAIDEDSHPEAFYENGSMGLSESTDIEHRDNSSYEGTQTKVAPLPSSKETIASMLASLMEAVRTTVACECVYVRAAIIKALIWMQSPNESFDELEAIIASELSDPFWSSSLLNDILLTLHARFKATPEMAVTLLEIARIFATKVPGKIDADVLQLLWKTCLVGAGPGGKHTALEAVTVVLDLPPPQPGSMEGFSSIDRVSASDPKSALALQRLVQAAVWFLGENANYAASEYAWESATPPGTALMMLDADKMVAAASSRNPTLAGALTRLQRWAFSGSWEVRIIAAQALITIAIRSGEPFRLQIYEFLHVLAQGGMQTKFIETQLSNGEDQGASGTGLSSIIAPMLRVLDEMYKSQDELIKEMRNHDNNKQEWTDDELRKLYETHERLLDLVSLFCYLPRSKYLPLGPISAKLIDIYRNRHHIDAATGFNDPAVAQGISDLILDRKVGQSQYTSVSMETANAWAAHLSDGLLGDDAPGVNLVNEYLAGAGTDAPEVEEENLTSRASVSYDDMWAKTLLEASDGEEDDARSSGTSSPESTASFETSVSSQFGTMHYPSLFSSGQSSHGTISRLVAETRFASHIIVLRRLVQVKDALQGMVISNNWGVWKQKNTERANKIKERLLADSWWERVGYLLKITEPIMSMLRYADMDRPCLGEIYDGIDSMIEKIKQVINEQEQDPQETFFKQVQKIINERWNKMTTPLHLLAYALTPKYYSSQYCDLPGRLPPYRDMEVSDGYQAAFRRIFPDDDIRDVIMDEFIAFVNATGLSNDALRHRFKKHAHGWWYLHGQKFRTLQPLAIKVISQEDKSVPGQSRLSNLSTISSSQDHQLDSRVSRGEPPSYESTIMQRFESFENPMASAMTQDFEEDEEHVENPQFGKALYDFTAGGDDELNLTAGEEVEIEYEVDGWFYVRKKRPGRDGKMVGLVPVLYVSPS